MKSAVFLLSNFALLAFAHGAGLETTFQIFMTTDDAIDYLEDEVIFQEDTNYETICEAHIPIEWTSDGKFSSHWTEPKMWRSDDYFKSTLEAKYTQSATGYLSCEPLDKSPENLKYSKRVYVYVNGSSPFAKPGRIVVNLNKEKRFSSERVVPCRTTLPNLTPKLLNVVSGIEIQTVSNFNPRIGFTLDADIKPGEEYRCCVLETCVEYKITGKPFYVSPNSTIIHAVSSTPLALQCQGSQNLTVEAGEKAKVTTESLNLFSGGPLMLKNIIVKDVEEPLEVTCTDGDQHHTWSVLPPAVFPHLDNQTAKFFYQRNAFVCQMNTTSFWARNLLCDDANSCALKSKCFEDNSCPTIIKPGLSCSEPLCLAVGYPYPTGIFECGTDDSKFTTTYFTGLDRHQYDIKDEATIPLNALVRIEEIPLPYYSGYSAPFVVYCQHILFTLAREAIFSFKFKNGTIRRIGDDEQLEATDEEIEKLELMHFRDTHAELVKIDPAPDVNEIICSVPKINSMGYVSVSRKLQIIQSKQPEIFSWIPEKTIFIDESTPTVIVCNVTGQPEPVVSWKKTRSNVDLVNNTTENYILSNGSILTFTKIDESIAGIYTCHAENGVGSATKNMTIEIKHNLPPSQVTSIWAIVLPLLIVFCGLVVVSLLYRRRKRQLNELVRFLSEKEVHEFFKGNQTLDSGSNANNDAAEFVNQLPYNNLYEISDDSLQFSERKVLGKGNFGVVYKGILDSTKLVAVKTITDDTDKKSFLSLLLEIKVMTHVGYHPHVVEFLGAVTKNIKTMEVFVVVEFCLNGDLHAYLKSRSSAMVDNSYANYDPNQKSGYLELNEVSISTKKMLEWSLQICLGVEHLAKRKVVHGDIAARNILLDSNLCAKVADFGLSNRITNYSEYVKMGQAAPLPWRWMAVESLETYRFSYASDVWAVGITIWEIFSFGNTPYAGMSWNFDYVEQLAAGFRLKRPEICPFELYEAIKETWNPSVKGRMSLPCLQERIKSCMN